MTKAEYVKRLATLYYEANKSDTEQAPSWMVGDECAVHCRAFDQVVRAMGLSEIWGNLLEGDDLNSFDE